MITAIPAANIAIRIAPPKIATRPRPPPTGRAAAAGPVPLLRGKVIIARKACWLRSHLDVADDLSVIAGDHRAAISPPETELIRVNLALPLRTSVTTALVAEIHRHAEPFLC